MQLETDLINPISVSNKNSELSRILSFHLDDFLSRGRAGKTVEKSKETHMMNKMIEVRAKFEDYRALSAQTEFFTDEMLH